MAVEGVAGAGKTTHLTKVKNLLCEDTTILIEPIEKFQLFSRFNPLTELYKNVNQNGGICQIHFINVLIFTFKEILEKNPESIIGYFCLAAVPIFIETMFKLGHLIDFARCFILEYFDICVESVKPQHKKYVADAIFYIDIPAEAAFEIMKERERASES